MGQAYLYEKVERQERNIEIKKETRAKERKRKKEQWDYEKREKREKREDTENKEEGDWVRSR